MIDGIHIVRYGKRDEGVFQFSGVPVSYTHLDVYKRQPLLGNQRK